MSVYLLTTSRTQLPTGLYKCTWALLWPYEQSSSTHFSLLFQKCLVRTGETWGGAGAMQSLKTYCSMDRMGQDDCIFTYVESTRWGRIHISSPNVRLALQTPQCKLHLMMQKEILDDLLTPREDQTGNTSL